MNRIFLGFSSQFEVTLGKDIPFNNFLMMCPMEILRNIWKAVEKNKDSLGDEFSLG